LADVPGRVGSASHKRTVADQDDERGYRHQKRESWHDTRQITTPGRPLIEMMPNSR
jgi:hypothetical protein